MGLLQAVRRVSYCSVTLVFYVCLCSSTAPPDLSTLQCGTVRKPPEGAGCLRYVLEPGSSQWCAQARHMQWCSHRRSEACRAVGPGGGPPAAACTGAWLRSRRRCAVQAAQLLRSGGCACAIACPLRVGARGCLRALRIRASISVSIVPRLPVCARERRAGASQPRACGGPAAFMGGARRLPRGGGRPCAGAAHDLGFASTVTTSIAHGSEGNRERLTCGSCKLLSAAVSLWAAATPTCPTCAGRDS
jgi:hypothetical protein